MRRGYVRLLPPSLQVQRKPSGGNPHVWNVQKLCSAHKGEARSKFTLQLQQCDFASFPISRAVKPTGALVSYSKVCVTCYCLQVNAAPNPLAKEELNLLAKLMGGLEFQKSGNADSGFRVNLFATDEEEE